MENAEKGTSVLRSESAVGKSLTNKSTRDGINPRGFGGTASTSMTGEEVSVGLGATHNFVLTDSTICFLPYQRQPKNFLVDHSPLSTHTCLRFRMLSRMVCNRVLAANPS